MKTPSLYRSLSADQRVALILHAMRSHKGARAGYAQRLVNRGGGFRAATLLAWPPDRLAREVVRLNAETAEDELELLQVLYLELQPQYQIAFLDYAGVPHENGSIGENVEPPFTDSARVVQAVNAFREKFGEEGEHYLRTITRYNAAAWPGIETLVGA